MNRIYVLRAGDVGMPVNAEAHADDKHSGVYLGAGLGEVTNKVDGFEADGSALKDFRDRSERDFIIATLKRNKGNISQSAADLGIPASKLDSSARTRSAPSTRADAHVPMIADRHADANPHAYIAGASAEQERRNHQ